MEHFILLIEVYYFKIVIPYLRTPNVDGQYGQSTDIQDLLMTSYVY